MCGYECFALPAPPPVIPSSHRSIPPLTIKSNLPPLQCDEGLVCFQREAMESVPGCSGSAPSGADICTSPDWIDFVNGNARRLSESEPEASAQGERRTQQGGPIIVQTGRTYNVWLTAPEGGPARLWSLLRPKNENEVKCGLMSALETPAMESFATGAGKIKMR